MSAELFSASGNNASLQGTTIGGSKPLHRFIKGQPKITGIIVLVLGTSFFIVSIAIIPSHVHIRTVIPPGFLLGLLFIICGILYILTDHNPTKKTVTISLALSIVTLLSSCSTILHIIPSFAHSHYYRHYEILDENATEMEISEAAWMSYYEAMGVSMEAVYLFYIVVGTVILIIMSTLAGAALRSTKSQAIIVMTTAAPETPGESEAHEEVQQTEQREEL